MRKPVFIKSFSEFLLRLWREFNRDRCPVRASNLAFTSPLALVPARQEEMLTYISRFVENTRGLGVIGLVFFLITSVFLLAGIQHTFGAVIGAVSWEIVRAFFIFWANYVIRLSVVYGSLAVVPIFLTWLYLAWTIVLLSIEAAYVHQHRGKRSLGTSTWAHEPAEMLRCGLELYSLAARQFTSVAKPPSNGYLANQLGITEGDVSHLVRKFGDANLLIPAGEKGRSYVPSQELSSVTAEEVARCRFGASSEDYASNPAPGRLFDVMIRGAIDSIRGSSIKDLIDSNSIVPPKPEVEIACQTAFGRVKSKGHVYKPSLWHPAHTKNLYNVKALVRDALTKGGFSMCPKILLRFFHQ